MGKEKNRLDWWRQGRFGLFIHWGLYAVPAGRWKGKAIPATGEWIMHQGKIPAAEYEKIAGKFNPVKFNARQWVQLAKTAGMKYLVITAKHHDGFAMYDSPSSDYDIVDATPFGRDPIKELAQQCRKAGIKLCFYYSQDQDWHDPDGSHNDWDYDESKKDFASYLRRKVKPQVRELLTQYGPIGLIWFDTPFTIAPAQSRQLSRLVHSLQPKCLVSGRVGHGMGDYGSLGDNQIPTGRAVGDWETPATLNDTWGFKRGDQNWKSVDTLLELLVDLAAKGVNYLLNVGPTAQGVIPSASVKRLNEIGKWMKVNGEAIHGADASPFPCDPQNVRITQRRGKVYMMFLKWPGGKFRLFGLKSKVKKAYLLADKRKNITVTQTYERRVDQHVLELDLPRRKPGKHVAVVVLTIAGRARVDETPMQQPGGHVNLLPHQAQQHTPAPGKAITIGPSGITENWYNKSYSLSWDFKLFEPGEFEVKVFTSNPLYPRKWFGGHKVKVSVAGKDFRRVIRADEMVENAKSRHQEEAATIIGKVHLDQPGTYRLKLKPEQIKKATPAGLNISMVQLAPIKAQR